MRLELHPKQSEAFHSPATEILFGGAAGGGKSFLLRVAALAWCVGIPGLQVYLFRRTFPDLQKNHLDGPTGFPALLAEWVDQGIASINYSKSYISIGRSRIHLCHCQYEKDVYNYQGAEIHVLLMDELTHFTESQYRYLRSRVRLAGLNLPADQAERFPRIVCASNPGGVGHNFVKQTFVDYVAPMECLRAPEEEGGMLRQFIPSLLEDNPTLTEEDPQYEARLEGLGRPELVRAMRLGDWNIVAGGMVDDVYVPEIHELEPFEIPEGWRIDRSFDWGSAKPFSVGWWAESDGNAPAVLSDGTERKYPRGTLFRIHEWYGWNGRANEGCRMISPEIARGILEREKDFPWGKRVQPGPADASIFDVTEGDSIADAMSRVGVRWQPCDKSPGSRKTGAEEIRKRLAACWERDAEGKVKTRVPMEEPGLFAFRTCRNGFIRTIPTIARSTRDPEDVDTDSEDHPWDDTRYRCRYREKRGYAIHLR